MTRVQVAPDLLNLLARGEKLLLACNRLTRPTFGLPPKYMQRLYTAIVVPKVEYALPVWYFPPHRVPNRKQQVGSVHHLRLLSKIQRLASILISGGFRTTSTDVLELHANIAPINLRLEDTCYREALRLCSLPKSHPLHKPVERSAKRQPRHHRTVLHNLLSLFKLRPDTIETIDPVGQNPFWFPNHSHHIAKSREEGTEAANARTDNLKIFTDGSGIDGFIGAAARTCGQPVETLLKYRLGRATAQSTRRSLLSWHSIL